MYGRNRSGDGAWPLVYCPPVLLSHKGRARWARFKAKNALEFKGVKGSSRVLEKGRKWKKQRKNVQRDQEVSLTSSLAANKELEKNERHDLTHKYASQIASTPQGNPNDREPKHQPAARTY